MHDVGDNGDPDDGIVLPKANRTEEFKRLLTDTMAELDAAEKAKVEPLPLNASVDQWRAHLGLPPTPEGTEP